MDFAHLDLHVSNKDYTALITALREIKSNVTPHNVWFNRWQPKKEDVRELLSILKGKLFNSVLDFTCNMTFEELNGDYSIER